MQKALSNRLEYPCLKTHSYLNQASLGLIGEPAVAAMRDFLDNTARHGNLHMSDAQEAAFLQPLRGNVSRLIGCAPENLAIVSSASEILAQVPTLFAPKPKSKIITVASDFPAITRPWISACHLMDCQMVFVDDVADHNLTKAIIDQILSLIHISEPTRPEPISYAVFCLKKKSRPRARGKVLKPSSYCNYHICTLC